MNQQPIEGFTPFKQIPEWADDAQFTITGAQLKSIQRMFEAYTPFIKAIEPVFVSALQDGVITIRYEDLEGNPMAKEDIDAMLKLYAERMTAQMSTKPPTDEVSE